MTTTDDDRAAMELVATLVQANVDDLAHTTDALIGYHKDNSVVLAKALTTLVDAIDNAATVDRALANMLIYDDTVFNGIIAANSVLRQEASS